MKALLQLPASDPTYPAPAAVWPGATPAEAGAQARARLAAIDLLRGLVMVLMALDHTRDFFHDSGFNPRDVTDPALFLTRWITHFCAPVFIFLSGLSAWLYGAQGRSLSEVSRFLLVRGLFLIVLEFTVVRFAWTFSPSADVFAASVIWAIGASMVALAALVRLPRPAIAILGVAMIAGHNLLDGVRAADFGWAGWIWNVLHQPGVLRPTEGTAVYVGYPLLPWIGVMAAGYALGPVMALDPERRRQWLVWLGAAVTAGFVLLRAANLYGDPAPWTLRDSPTATLLSFLNCEKYPPSLLYLMMTLGPALMLLAAFETARGALARALATIGRAPLFYYVAHLFLIHLLAVIYALWTQGDASWLVGGPGADKPPGAALDLAGVYVVWAIVVVLLYPSCRWFAALKESRRSERVWSYL